MRGGNEPATGRERTDIERLVKAAAAGEQGAPGDPRWSALLRVLTAAARGAAVDPEREQAAVVAFRAATSARAGQDGGTARRGVRARRRGRPLRSARALAGGLAAVFALCGVAVAAGTGVLPARSHTSHSGPPPAPAARTAAPAPGPSEAARETARPAPPAHTMPPAATATAPAGGPPGHSRATGPHGRSPALVRALCRLYLAAGHDGRTPPARLTARLQREAGGSRRITAYCRALLPAPPVATTPGATTKRP
ncbi:hypothetical protein [Streptomyces sp. NBC_01198]|uniref:hypothetical protein n=1 Tax=Streptomyces sp. NBC_01198 TaxID=2903769 RepID=UPI002E156BAD|nr:hypothetical protein OG702_31375 [Streptomyces sp. NBC_01198]